MLPRVLIIDDDAGICASLEALLAKDGHRVTVAGRGDVALALLEGNEFEIVFADLRLPDMNGLDVIPRIRARLPNAQIIVMTGFATIETAVSAIKMGAYDYLPKPLTPDTVRITTSRAMERRALTDEIVHLRQELAQCFGFENLVGKSPTMQGIFKIIRQTAKSDSNVLITGESGTGKEMVARAIHYSSPRREGRFVPVNCGAIAKDLVEAELFGYVKGAFTGASRDRTGFLELASGGTLFLDEIGETAPDFQVKLLRVIQDGEFYKVGTPHPTKVNVRIVAATNRDPAKAVSAGTFREDLFYRLNVISIHLPPLRQRREDVPLLALHFVADFARRKPGSRAKSLTPSALDALMSHDYPGNVRELENAIEYAVAFAPGEEITVNDLPASMRNGQREGPKVRLKPLKVARQEFERSFVEAALRQCGGNISRAARLLDIQRQSLQQKIHELGIRLDDVREEHG
ncbi:MAG TPA: sigma-54 dependent transcriptional regulator [Anaeromyxobacter sp.]|nr:sigma-54 dependent transcriptional regulator [Anaeromyxobacter sp.]